MSPFYLEQKTPYILLHIPRYSLGPPKGPLMETSAADFHLIPQILFLPLTKSCCYSVLTALMLFSLHVVISRKLQLCCKEVGMIGDPFTSKLLYEVYVCIIRNCVNGKKKKIQSCELNSKTLWYFTP